MELPHGQPKIERIELTPLFVPFYEHIRQTMQAGAGGLGMAIPAEQPWLGGDFVIAVVTAEDGTQGLGEAFVWLPETGVSPTGILDAVQNALAPYVLGESPFHVQKIRHRMDSNVTRNEVAKGLLDMACYDVAAKIARRPACDLMGGRCVSQVPMAALVPLMDPVAMAGLAKGYVDHGHQAIRLKLGRSIAEEVAIVRRVREAVGTDVRLRVDYNQAYTPDQAVLAIGAIEPYRIDFAEQPVTAENYLGMAYVQQRVTTPLMAHEGCFSIRDIAVLIELGAVRTIGINSERPGGVTAALEAIDYAYRRGLGIVIHNQPLGIASAMHLHLAAAQYHKLGHAPELFGHVMFEDDLIEKPICYDGGIGTLPEGSGWGVALDRAALDKYATGKTVVVSR